MTPLDGASDGLDGRTEARPASIYRERPPPPVLAAHFACLWTQSIDDVGSDYPQRVLPDGCADIVWIGDAAPVVAGPATRTFVASLPPRSLIIGARFRPGLASSVLGLPASELLNMEVPLSEVWGRAADETSARLARGRSVGAKLALLDAVLAERLAKARPADDLATAAVTWLARHPTGRVHQFSRLVGISSRQLQRRITAAVGYGPKTLQRVLRFQRVLALAERPAAHRLDLASLAAAAGYADQAHMNREIRQLAGQTPAALLGWTGVSPAMSDFFNTAGDPGV